MTPSPTQADVVECRACGSDCRIETFPAKGALATDVTLWLCSQHKMFGGSCPSDMAYFSEEAWNRRDYLASPPAGGGREALAALEHAKESVCRAYCSWSAYDDHPLKHYDECERLSKAIAALSAPPPSQEGDVQPRSSAELHQRRGMMADAILAALYEYDEFMKDDSYDYRNALEGVIAPLKRVRDVAKMVEPAALGKVSRADIYEECARLIEENQETESNAIGKHLTPRMEGNLAGLTFATAIRERGKESGR